MRIISVPHIKGLPLTFRYEAFNEPLEMYLRIVRGLTSNLFADSAILYLPVGITSGLVYIIRHYIFQNRLQN